MYNSTDRDPAPDSVARVQGEYKIGRCIVVMRGFIRARSSFGLLLSYGMNTFPRCRLSPIRGVETLAFVLIFCVVPEARAESRGSHLAAVRARGELVVLTYNIPTPFVLINDGQVDGVDYEIMRSFAKSLGVTLRVRVLPTFRGLIPAIVRGDADIAAASISISAERERIVDFSEPYFPNRTAVLTRANAPWNTLLDLKGRRVSVMPESRAEMLAAKFIPNVVLVRSESYGQRLACVLQGGCDLTVGDLMFAIAAEKKYKTLKLAFFLPNTDEYGFVLPEGSDLNGPLSAHIRYLRSTGLLHSILERHLGPQAALIVSQARHGRAGASPCTDAATP